ncbi:unnamed protein product [Meloidogyne enterolobii]|uniref:Uncharacterized protein n=1 Tax=Meloidogyne enterolobii TaxID=390850 RepID=A0ACB1ANJ0_MELEN
MEIQFLLLKFFSFSILCWATHCRHSSLITPVLAPGETFKLNTNKLSPNTLKKEVWATFFVLYPKYQFLL